MRRPLHQGQTPRPLQEKVTRKSWPQVPHGDGSRRWSGSRSRGATPVSPAGKASAEAGLIGFDVQRGAAQRLSIRYLDLVLESGAGLTQLIAEGRVRLTRFGLGGLSPVNVPLAGKLTVVGNRIVIDFGAQGIGGNRNTTAGNWYYRLSVDTDRNGSFESLRHFYRLLGDTNGDRTVNAIDRNVVNANLGRRGANLNADVNRNGVVNSTDQYLVRQNVGRVLASSLPLDD